MIRFENMGIKGTVLLIRFENMGKLYQIGDMTYEAPHDVSLTMDAGVMATSRLLDTI